MTEPKYWGYKQAAESIGIPIGTLYAKVSRKEIPHVRLGRRHVLFPIEDVLAWLKSNQVPNEKQERDAENSSLGSRCNLKEHDRGETK